MLQVSSEVAQAQPDLNKNSSHLMEAVSVLLFFYYLKSVDRRDLRDQL